MTTQSTAVVPEQANEAPAHFIRRIIREDLDKGHVEQVVTRFPPEPNGYLHVGHIRSICLNFAMAKEFGGRCHLRFDDTNPAKESLEYVQAIKEAVRWLGFDWGDHLYHTSDYFERLYQYAEQLIQQGDAFVCDLDPQAMREQRGTLTQAGQNSPWRDRSVEENLDLFRAMRAGDFADGARVLRARIDMAAGNINLRDPVLYRIRRQTHPATGDQWCIYPTYDYSHCLADAIEKISHSLCTLEFADHRPLYDWVLQRLQIVNPPQQIEFAKLNINYTVMSKRWLNRLVEQHLVSGWDDPRLMTIAGIRRRGFPPAALRQFCEQLGVSKKDTIIDMSVLEGAVRQELETSTPRVMAVLNPIRLIIDNWPQDQVEWLEAPLHPQQESLGKRTIPFSGELWIEADDFTENPPRKYRRLTPGKEVRLRYGYVVECSHVERDEQGQLVAVHCRYDPQTRSGSATNTRKVKGTIHWVSAAHAVDAQVHLFDRLFTVEAPLQQEQDCTHYLNPHSRDEVSAKLEPYLDQDQQRRYQFERLGYFARDDRAGHFNRIVTLRDRWTSR